MRKYKHYKDSGIEWIGEIPEHWEIERFKYDFLPSKGLTITKSDLVDNGWPVVNYGQIHSKLNLGTGINGDLIRYVPISYRGLYLKEVAAQNDFIFADTSEDIEGCGNCVFIDKNQEIFAGYHTIIAKSRHKEYGRYFSYLFLTNEWRSQIRSRVYGVKVFSITQNILFNTKVILPSLPEQQSIANYLDKKCGLIDRMIGNLQKKIELLKELKSSVISQAVTKGLDPHVKMKDSGIEWIGEIPEHWEIEPFKRYLREPLKYGANEAAESDCKYWPRYIRITDIDENGKLREETFKSLSSEKARDYILKKGDILFARSGATVGKTYIYNSDSPACYAGYLIRAECNENLYSNFIYYYTKSGVYENWKNSISIQSTIQNIGADKYSLMPVILPPLPEQQSIANYLDKKCEKIDSTVTKAQRKIDLLKEYKTALISEVVTGKRKVSA
jgi:type I restriction enzyme S subunit